MELFFPFKVLGYIVLGMLLVAAWISVIVLMATVLWILGRFGASLLGLA